MGLQTTFLPGALISLLPALPTLAHKHGVGVQMIGKLVIGHTISELAQEPYYSDHFSNVVIFSFLVVYSLCCLMSTQNKCFSREVKQDHVPFKDQEKRYEEISPITVPGKRLPRFTKKLDILVLERMLSSTS